jgi:heat shock 70kDa protein 4
VQKKKMLTIRQEWLYDDGEDASKAQYVSKMEEIRFVAGPVIQRYNDKQEEERQARLKAEEEANAKRRAEMEAKKKEDEAKKAAEKPSEPQDTEMTDTNGESVKPEGVEEAK